MFKYIAGSNIYNALRSGKKILNNGKRPVINYVIESQNKKSQVSHEYKKLYNHISSDYRVAIKLSSFDFDYDLVNQSMQNFKKKNVQVLVDAESNELDKLYQDNVNKLILENNCESAIVFKTYQMYRKDSLETLNNDIKLFKENGIYHGIKLVRGAYFNSEFREGHLYTNKYDTDLNYNTGIDELANNINNNKIVPILATHNSESIDKGVKWNNRLNYNLFEFGHLMGMKENKYNQLKYKYDINVYIPYGPYDEMMPYLLRRLYENKDSIKYMFL